MCSGKMTDLFALKRIKWFWCTQPVIEPSQTEARPIWSGVAMPFDDQNITHVELHPLKLSWG